MNVRKEIRKVLREQITAPHATISDQINTIKQLIIDIEELYGKQLEYHHDLEDAVNSMPGCAAGFERASLELSLIRDTMASGAK